MQWAEMYHSLAETSLPENLSQFHEALYQQVGVAADYRALTRETIEQELAKLVGSGKIEKIPPYSELRWVDHNEWLFSNKSKEQFFISNKMEQSPLQYIRSRVQNFCDSKGIVGMQKDEIVISVTEAAENAIKYSNVLAVFIEHGLEHNEYYIRTINSVSELNLKEEITRGKFSEEFSLMRGVLVMSKLLDYIDIARNNDKRWVEFIGKKKVSLKAESLSP
ncbi:MAG: hypothetical protein N2Z22_04105 [Turneriella sp.]|nr:hypothetical protein [Turneriella sp.]